MQASRNQFFTDTNSHNQMICVDHQSRISEARAFFCKENSPDTDFMNDPCRQEDRLLKLCSSTGIAGEVHSAT